MEPIKINIEIGVTPELAALIGGLRTTCQETAAQKSPKATPSAPKAAESEPSQLPEPPRPEQTAEVTDEMLRAAVKAAKDRTSAQTVRGLFKEFGIQASSECPADKRAALLQGLENLKAA